jgi:DNA polymerase I-like protein with 3'-5' exonuclease and polymerase domains
MAKQAMVDLHQQGITPMIMVHDELDCSVNSLEEAQHIAQVMVDAVPLAVPSKCDIDMGPSWGEAVPTKT